jgi:hypothetical protein
VIQDRVRARAHNHCEALVRVRGVFTRCGSYAPDVHHALTKSRGGDVLDSLGELYHLVALCRSHHTWVHLHPDQATDSGLYILGQVWVDGGRVVYQGPDSYLSGRYGRNPVGDQVRSVVTAGR